MTVEFNLEDGIETPIIETKVEEKYCEISPNLPGQDKPQLLFTTSGSECKIYSKVEPHNWFVDRQIIINSNFAWYGVFKTNSLSETFKFAGLITILERLKGVCLPYLHTLIDIPIEGDILEQRTKAYENLVKAGVEKTTKPISPSKIKAASIFISKTFKFKGKELFTESFFKERLPTNYSLPSFDLKQPAGLFEETEDYNKDYIQLWFDCSLDYTNTEYYWRLYFLAVNEQQNRLELVPIRVFLSNAYGTPFLDLRLLTKMILYSYREQFTAQELEDLMYFCGAVKEDEFKDKERNSLITEEIPDTYFYDSGKVSRAMMAQDGKTHKELINSKSKTFMITKAYTYDPTTGKEIERKYDNVMLQFAIFSVLPAAITWIETHANEGIIVPCLKSHFVKLVMGSNKEIPEYVIYNGKRQKSGQWDAVERALNILRSRYIDIKDNQDIKKALKDCTTKEFDRIINPGNAAILNWDEDDNEKGQRQINFINRPIISRLSEIFGEKHDIPAKFINLEDLRKPNGRTIIFSINNQVIVNALGHKIYSIGYSSLPKTFEIDNFLEENCKINLKDIHSKDAQKKDKAKKMRTRCIETIIAKLEDLRAAGLIKDFKINSKGKQKYFSVSLSFGKYSYRGKLEQEKAIKEDNRITKAEKAEKKKNKEQI